MTWTFAALAAAGWAAAAVLYRQRGRARGLAANLWVELARQNRVLRRLDAGHPDGPVFFRLAAGRPNPRGPHAR